MFPLESFPPEWQTLEQELPDVRVTRLTSAPYISHPLYYLTNTFSCDSRWLVFASDRAGKMDLYRASLEDGRIERLTDVQELQPFSGNVVDDTVYFTTSGRLHSLNLCDGSSDVLAHRPGCGFGEVTLSSDRRHAATLFTRGSSAGLLIVSTDGGESSVILEGKRALYHPQFHPTDPTRLIYSADPPDPRMWTVRIDGSGDRPVFRNRQDEWFVHETFLGQSEELIVVHWHHGLLAVELESGSIRQVSDLSSWHICSNPEGSLIACDTHLPDVGLHLIDPPSGRHRLVCRPMASNQGWQWKQPLPLSADGEAPGWATMVEEEATETAYGPQWSHPHPSFSPNGRLLAFTSDVSGHPQAYVADLTSIGPPATW